MNRVDGAMALVGVPSRPQEDPRGTSFSRHQAWMREFEKANDAGRVAIGLSDSKGLGDAAALTDMVPGVPAASALTTPKPVNAFQSSRAMPDAHARPAAEPRLPAPPAALVPLMPHRVGGMVSPSRPRPPASALVAHARADAVEARCEVRGYAYADHSAQVYRQGDQLSLVLRDARLSDAQGDAILRALIGRGLPAGIRRVNVTLNGHTRAFQLQDPGA